jgi:ADP-dependent NAD(P)H-hydrate dehydratase / NAD(P)H-hydrate epimerase
MKIVSAAEMREIDRITSERFGVPSHTLMESAGGAVAEFVLRQFAKARKIAVVCGKGNNGGDGFVAARNLREGGREVAVVFLGDPAELRGDAALMFEKLGTPAVVVRSAEELRGAAVRTALDADVLVDAILGTGFRPPVAGVYAEAIAALNARETPVVAVDIPSGADADVMGQQTGEVARADAIITFTAPRPAHVFGELTNGPTVVAPIGSPDDAIASELNLNLITAHDILWCLAPRPVEVNKGTYGHALVLGGSFGKSGAAAMAGFSVLRVGAGLSTVATPKSAVPTVAGFHPELMTEPLQENDDGTISLRALEYGHFDELVKGKTVLAIGPGISRNPQTAEFVRTLVAKYSMPMVVDADGLNAFDGCAEKLQGREHPLVITPHPGEMARLTGKSIPEVQRDRIGVARTFAREHNAIVVLKGHRTVIADPGGEVWVNVTGNAGMATGGTGDVLTGMAAGLMAQSPKEVRRAVIAAVYLHGLAGDVARESVGEASLVATDLIRSLPQGFERARAEAKESSVEFHS